jgi:hypothetical protein
MVARSSAVEDVPGKKSTFCWMLAELCHIR